MDDIAAGTLVKPFDPLAVHFATAYWIVLPTRVRSTTSVFVEWIRKEATG